MPKIDPKIKRAREEAEQRRRSRRLNLIILVLLVGILLEFLYLFSRSKFFSVHEIQVKGNRRVSSERIVALSGINQDTNIFQVSAKEVTRKLSREVWVERADVRRKFPLRMEIVVQERKPLAVVAFRDRFVLVDKEAKILQVEKENIFPSLPVIREVTVVGKIAPGRSIKSLPLSNALLCLKYLETDLKSSIFFLSAPSIDGLALQLRSGLVILYGKVELPDEKNYAIKAIVAQAESRGQRLKYIDVRVPSNPAAMPEP